MYTIDSCPHFGCGDCLYFKVNADMDNVESLCKRIDHKNIKFAVPFFKAYDCGQMYHIPCGDFIPKHLDYADAKEWTNFNDFWAVYVEAWLPYGNENITVPFTINGDTSVRYHVPLKKFIDGTMIIDDVLQAVEKEYVKRAKIEYGIQLYEIVHEKISGVKIGGEHNDKSGKTIPN